MPPIQLPLICVAQLAETIGSMAAMVGVLATDADIGRYAEGLAIADSLPKASSFFADDDTYSVEAWRRYYIKFLEAALQALRDREAR